MRRTLAFAFALLLPSSALAQAAEPTTRAAQQGYQQGFRDCAPDLDAAVKFVHGDDAGYGHLGVWSKDNPNGEAFSSLTADPRSGVAAFTGVKTAAGVCDTVFTQIQPAPQDCAQIQKTALKDWKPLGDLRGLPLYEDPTTASVTVLLVPLGKKSCLIVKHAVFYPG